MKGLKFHQCSKCSNLESVPFDVGYVCPATGREFDRKEVNKPILCSYYDEGEKEMKFNVGEEVSVRYRGELCKAIINGVDTSLARKGGELRYILRIPNRGYSIVVESEIR